MSIVLSRHRQRGVSAWTIVGSLLVVAGIAGLGVALIKPGSQAPGTAPVATGGGTGALVMGGVGPHPNWHGTWQGETPGSRLDIGPAGVDRTFVREDEGKNRTHTERCKWTPRESASGEGCQSGYAKSSKAAAAIQAEYERSVEAFRRDPSDFNISDPARSRAALRSVTPGNYRVLWTEGEGDCSRNEMIIDNDTVLDVMQCHYGHHVERFTRIR